MSKLKAYIDESISELKTKVSWPTWSELQSSTIIVMVASMIIALIIYLMDVSFSMLLNLFYQMFT
jgi:preprotein translocase subunit SecE